MIYDADKIFGVDGARSNLTIDLETIRQLYEVLSNEYINYETQILVVELIRELRKILDENSV